MKISLLVITLGFLAAATFADDKPTSLGDARAAVEANLKTPEGKTYDEKLGKEFVDKHLGTMKQCKQSAGSDLESFWILMKLDKDGSQGSSIAPCDQDGRVRKGGPAQEYVLRAASISVLGERLHEIDALSAVAGTGHPRRPRALREIAASSQA